MSKFKMGDSVVGNELATAKYGITRQGWRGAVDRVEGVNIYVVGQDGRGYWVEDKYFNLELYTIEEIKGKKVAIRVKNEEEFNILLPLLRSKENRYPYSDASHYTSLCLNAKDGCYCGEEYYEQEDYQIIDFSQIKINNTTMSKNVIGYKLKKEIPGDLRTIGTEVKCNGEQSYYSLLPDFWDPIYEEVPQYRIGDYVYIITDRSPKEGIQYYSVSPGNVLKVRAEKGDEYCGGTSLEDDFINVFPLRNPNSNGGYNVLKTMVRPATPEEVNALKKVQIGTYKADFGKGYVNFGCQRFEKAEIQAVQHLLNDDIQADITIAGQKITRSIVEKILANI